MPPLSAAPLATLLWVLAARLLSELVVQLPCFPYQQHTPAYAATDPSLCFGTKQQQSTRCGPLPDSQNMILDTNDRDENKNTAFHHVPLCNSIKMA